MKPEPGMWFTVENNAVYPPDARPGSYIKITGYEFLHQEYARINIYLVIQDDNSFKVKQVSGQGYLLIPDRFNDPEQYKLVVDNDLIAMLELASFE